MNCRKGLGLFAALFLAGILVNSGCEKPNPIHFDNSYFYDDQGRFLEAKAKDAYIAVMKHHGYSLATVVEKDPSKLWVSDYGAGQFAKLGLGAWMFANNTKDQYMQMDVYLLPNQMLPEHWHLAGEGNPAKHEGWLIRHGLSHVVGEGEPNLSKDVVIPRLHMLATATTYHETIAHPGEFVPLNREGARHWQFAGPQGAIITEVANCHTDSAVRHSDQFLNGNFLGVWKAKPVAMGVELPDKYNTPDGMVLAPDGSIILSMCNYNDRRYPAKMLRIGTDDKVTEICRLPMNPDSGRPTCPLGVDIGPDGNLYIADSQAFDTEDHKSRLIRVVMKDGKGVRTEVLVTGFVMSNAVSCQGDSVYVTETKLDPKASPLPSGVYRFKLAELDSAKPIKLLAGGKAPHLVATITTQNKDWPVGANGMGFGADGTMYVCNFGDAQILKFPMKDGAPSGPGTVLAEGNGMLCTDGLKVCPKTGDIYVADFIGNAVHKVDAKTGKVTTLAKNAQTTGAGGALDKPSEVCLRGNKVYVSNIDLNLDGNKYDTPHSISVIDVSK